MQKCRNAGEPNPYLPHKKQHRYPLLPVPLASGAIAGVQETLAQNANWFPRSIANLYTVTIWRCAHQNRIANYHCRNVPLRLWVHHKWSEISFALEPWTDCKWKPPQTQVLVRCRPYHFLAHSTEWIHTRGRCPKFQFFSSGVLAVWTITGAAPNYRKLNNAQREGFRELWELMVRSSDTLHVSVSDKGVGYKVRCYFRHLTRQ